MSKLTLNRSLNQLSSQLQLKNTAFLLCDIQEKFRPHIYQFDLVAQTANKMVTASKILKIPCIATEQHPKGLGPTAKEINIDSAVLKEPKTKFSMWIPSVESYFHQHNHLKNVVLFGIESHVCVLQTAKDFIKRDFQVYVLADGVSSMNKQEIKIALNRMKDLGATITTSDSLLFEMIQDAEHDDFKAISNLVKEFKSQTSDALKHFAE